MPATSSPPSGPSSPRPSPDTPPTIDPQRLTSRDLDALLRALAAESEWIAEAAYQTLSGLTNDQLRHRPDDLVDQLPAGRRELVADLARRISGQPGTAEPRVQDGEPAVPTGLVPWSAQDVLRFVRESAPTRSTAQPGAGSDPDRKPTQLMASPEAAAADESSHTQQ
jgi:hypothetical protein